jgi:hypothetical protein
MKTAVSECALEKYDDREPSPATAFSLTGPTGSRKGLSQAGHPMYLVNKGRKQD